MLQIWPYLLLMQVKISPLDAKSPHILMLAKVQLDQPTAVHSS